MAKVSKDEEIGRLQRQLQQLLTAKQELNAELLKERITRIDFQVQLLTQWRQRCQEELNQLLAPAQIQEVLTEVSGKVEGA